jgi:type IV pilus biogenesis/stability protein PilW
MRCLATVLGVWALMVVAGCASTSIREERENQPDLSSPAAINTQLGIHYMQQDKLTLAREKLERAVEQDPKLASAHHALALLYSRLNKNDLAEHHFRKAVRLAPKDPMINNTYGTFLCAQDHREQAEEHFKVAYEDPLYQTPWVPLTNAGMCALDLAQAQVYLRNALRINPKFAPALLQMVRVSYERAEKTDGRDRYLSARAYLQRYLEVAQHTSETLWLGIQVEEKLGDKGAAASYALLLKRNFPDSQETRLFLEFKGVR